MSEEIEKTNKINSVIPWIPMIELAVLALTTLGTTIILFVHSNTQMQEGRKETNALIEAIRQDMKEFHNEMKDYHGRLCTIEERNKK